MDLEESRQSVPPAEPAIESAPPVGAKPPAEPKAAKKPVRPPFITAGIFGAIMMVVYFVLPAIYKAHYEFLFWGEGFMERAYGMAFLTGNYQKLIETPKPLWSLFWLLGSTPNKMLLLLGLMTGGIFFLFPLVSWKLTRHTLPGIVASLLLVFGSKDVLSLMVQGSWITPYILLGLVFVLALYSRRFIWATLAVGLIGLFRPDGWFLAVFMLLYVVYQAASASSHKPRATSHKLKWYYFLPLLSPFLWMYYDHRMSGDWMYTYKTTVAYAVLTDVQGTNFASFWRVLVPDIISSTGVLVLLYALAGIVLRARNIAREARGSKVLAIVFDPLLGTALVPLIGYWLLSLSGNIVIMGRFVFLSVGLLTLLAMLLPYELFKNRPVANRGVVFPAIWLPLLLVGLVRLPAVGRDVHQELKISEAKMAAIQGLCDEVKKPVADLDQYKFILIPFRRYAVFENFLPESVAHKLISYREVSLAAVTAHAVATESQAPQSPKGSPEFLKRLMSGEFNFAGFLPAMALWVPDDEVHYIGVFAFDDTTYFRRNYIDPTDPGHHYAFRVIGAAQDSLGLVYDCRDLASSQIQVLPPEQDTSAPESPDTTLPPESPDTSGGAEQ